MNDSARAMSRLPSEECWAILQRSGTGVLATSEGGHPDLFPLNYLADGHTLIFRTAPGTKIRALEVNPNAAFAAQGQDADGHWSVVIRGKVEATSDQVEIVGSGALELAAWAPGSKRVFLRLTPTSVQGRRVKRADLARAPFYG